MSEVAYIRRMDRARHLACQREKLVCKVKYRISQARRHPLKHVAGVHQYICRVSI